MPATSPPAKAHLLYLDGMRAVAALFVVVDHALQQVGPGPVTTSFWLGQIIGVFHYGHYAVDVFIVLSGFCLMLPMLKADYLLPWPRARSFFARRARRILPPYFLAMGFSLLLIALFIGQPTGTQWDETIPVTAGDVVTHTLLVQDLFLDTTAKINHAFWSISVEWRIYFFFPVLVWCWRRFGPGATTAGTLLLSLGVLFALERYAAPRWPNLNLTPYGVCPHYLGLFAVGMLAADVARAKGRYAWRERVPWGAALAGLTIVIAYLSTHAVRGIPLHWALLDVLVAAWALCLLVGAGLGGRGLHGLFQRGLSWAPLAFVGTFAYSIYLVHAPLLQLVWVYGVHPFGLSRMGTFLALALAGTPVIVGASYLFYLACERPFLSRKLAASHTQETSNLA